jgi:hypothetical protein
VNLPHGAAVPAPSLGALIAGSQNPEIGLAAGTYREQLLLDRPVTLIALEGAGTVRILADRGPALTVRCDVLLRGVIVESLDPQAPALSVTAGAPVFEHCEFRGGRVETLGGSAPTFRHCSFAGSALAGLHAREGSRTRVENCTFERVRGHAVVVADAAALELRDSLLDRAQGAGLRLIGSARADVYSTTIHATGDPGAAVADAAALRMTACRISGCGAEGLRVDGSSLPDAVAPSPASVAAEPMDAVGAVDVAVGVVVDGSDAGSGAAGRILAALSTVPPPATAGPSPGSAAFDGSALADLHGVALVDCEIADCAGEGAVVGGGRLRMERTRVTGSGRAGLLAGGSARIELRACAITGSAGAGVLLRGEVRLRAEGVTVARCGGDGLTATEHAELDLVDTTVEQTDATAIRLGGHAGLRARGSRVRASRAHGLCLYGHALADLDRCRIEACAHEAVRVEGSADAVLRESEFAHCRTGIVLATRHHPVLRGCTVREARQHGIVVSSGGLALLTGCRVLGAGSVGLYLDEDVVARIEDCRIEGTGHAGLLVGRGAEPAVRGLAVSATGAAALYFQDGAAGVFEDCHIEREAGEPVRLGHGATPDLRKLRGGGGLDAGGERSAGVELPERVEGTEAAAAIRVLKKEY